MAKILHEHTTRGIAGETSVSVCLECELCKGRTWAWVDQAWTACSRCGVRIYNVDGVWEGGVKRDPEG